MADYWPQIISAVAGLGGAIIGASTSLFVQSQSRRTTKQEDVRSLALSLAAEAEAYLDLMERRGHVKYAKGIIRLNEAGVKTVPKLWLSGFEKQNDPFPILRSKLDKIGILGDICADLAKFYSQITAVRTTIALADEGAYNDADAQDMAYIMNTELGLWENSVQHGRWVIITLRKIAENSSVKF